MQSGASRQLADAAEGHDVSAIAADIAHALELASDLLIASVNSMFENLKPRLE